MGHLGLFNDFDLIHWDLTLVTLIVKVPPEGVLGVISTHQLPPEGVVRQKPR